MTVTFEKTITYDYSTPVSDLMERVYFKVLNQLPGDADQVEMVARVGTFRPDQPYRLTIAEV